MHVLVVEDEKKIGEHIKHALEQAQFSVLHVETGRKALEKVGKNEFDLIILDLRLPDIDGLEVCKKIRKMNVRTPILILTARNTIEQKVRGLDAGADDYLTKPFSFDELLARVRALVRREKNVHGTTLRVGDIELDSSKYVVHRNGTEIPLTSKEYMLLSYLMRHPNRLCTKRMLEEHVWGYLDMHHSNVIEVTISRLRKKMNRRGARDFITTRRGIGYIVEAFE